MQVKFSGGVVFLKMALNHHHLTMVNHFVVMGLCDLQSKYSTYQLGWNGMTDEVEEIGNKILSLVFYCSRERKRSIAWRRINN